MTSGVRKERHLEPRTKCLKRCEMACLQSNHDPYLRFGAWHNYAADSKHPTPTLSCPTPRGPPPGAREQATRRQLDYSPTIAEQQALEETRVARLGSHTPTCLWPRASLSAEKHRTAERWGLTCTRGQFCVLLLRPPVAWLGGGVEMRWHEVKAYRVNVPGPHGTTIGAISTTGIL
jgi:hypothetical protein